MTNLFNYVEKYGDISFENKEFNDIDNLVFSLLLYLDFTNTNVNNKNSLEVVGKEYLNKNKLKDIKKLGISQKEAYKLLEILINKKRYKNIILLNYIYVTNKDMQFSAMTFKLSKKLKYICFEGTDEMISGWKEDAYLACFFPVPSQIEAIKYVNKNTKLFGAKVILGGHSKGGNLALVSGMYMRKYKKFKVKKIYNNDGPGLRKKEFESKKYKKIKKKYIHIVPHSSVIGMLLRNDSYTVVKARYNNIIAHFLHNWILDDDKLKCCKLSRKSRNLEKNILAWLDKHDDTKRIKMVKGIFKILEENNIDVTMDLVKVKNVIKIIHGLRNLDKQTKELLINLIMFNHTEN